MNLGRDTPTSTGPKSFGKHKRLGFAADNMYSYSWNVEKAKHHHLHRPTNDYFSDKL
jgi:hypothetical protein